MSNNTSHKEKGPSIFGLRTVNINDVMDRSVENISDAMSWPDVLQVVYTFRFPEACNEFRKLFATDFNIFATDQWASGFGNNRVNVNVNGFGRYVLRCPFVPKALVISVDADAYSYTLPVGKVNKAAADRSGSTPTYTEGSGPSNPSTVVGKLDGNALFRHGVFTNLVRQYLLMCAGVRVEFDCDHVVIDTDLRSVGLASSYMAPIGATLSDAFQQDLSDLNQQLASMGADHRYVPENAKVEGYELQVSAFEQPTTVAPNGSSPQGDGTIPIQGIVLLAGQGIDVVLYTLPGLEQIRDQLLSQACLETLNPGGDLPLTLDQPGFVVVWGGNNMGVVPPEGVPVFVDAGDPVPDPTNLLKIQKNRDGSYEAIPAVPTWLGVITRPLLPGPPNLGPGSSNPETPLDPTQTLIIPVSRPIGSTETEIINHGELQLTFNLYGTYIPKKSYLEYFSRFAIRNKSLRELLLENQVSRDLLDKLAEDKHKTVGIDWIVQQFDQDVDVD